MSPSPTFLIQNPNAGSTRRKLLYLLCQRLKKRGVSTRLVSPPSSEVAAIVTGKLAEQYPNPTIIAAGGDGTIAPVMQGLLGTQGKLGILPAGTANVFAREMRLPSGLDNLASIIAKGYCVDIWPGVAQFSQSNGSIEKKLFIQMLGCGPDAWSVQHVNTKLKKAIGRYAYAASGISTLRKYPFYNQLKVNVDGKDYSCSSLVISKGIYYAGDYQIAPVSAQLKRRFNVILFNEKQPRGWLKRCLAIGTGRFRTLTGVKIIPAKHIEVTSSEPMPVQCDGDFCGFTPFSATIAPDPAKVIVPSLQCRG